MSKTYKFTSFFISFAVLVHYIAMSKRDLKDFCHILMDKSITQKSFAMNNGISPQEKEIDKKKNRDEISLHSLR
jgi:hypothetical protein